MHEQPESGVSVSGVRPGSYVTLTDRLGLEVIYNIADDVITIPADALTDSLDRQVKLTLVVNDSEFGGYILFLPVSENIEFGISEILRRDGTFATASSAKRTGYIDVSSVSDIIISGSAIYDVYCVAYAFDESFQPVRQLLGVGPYSDTHLQPDGGYRYIVVSSFIAYNPSCMVRYKDRRRH